MIMDPERCRAQKVARCVRGRIHVLTVCASVELEKPETSVTRLAMAHSLNLWSSPLYFCVPPHFRFTALSFPPTRTTIIDSHIQVINPMMAPSEP